MKPSWQNSPVLDCRNPAEPQSFVVERSDVGKQHRHTKTLVTAAFQYGANEGRRMPVTALDAGREYSADNQRSVGLSEQPNARQILLETR